MLFLIVYFLLILVKVLVDCFKVVVELVVVVGNDMF